MNATTAARLTVCSIVCGLVLLAHSPALGDNGVATLAEYFDLLVSGNLESAHDLWTRAALERSERFGIQYDGIPLKTDCSSPIVRNLSLMRDYLQPPVKTVVDLPGGEFKKLEYSALVNGKLVRHYYYLYYDGSYYWLTYPQDYYCRGWPVRETRYFRIHVDPEAEKYLNAIALEEADRFVERIADSLGLSGTDLETLREKKIEYFYCYSDSTVKDIVGSLVKGSFDLPSNDLISSFFPHYHELVHFLVNYKLRRLPLCTQPIIRGGIAACLGGRWGQMPSSLLDLGVFLYGERIVELDSLLTMSDFEGNSAADIAYPVAGLFTGYLKERLGREAFFELYLALSGDLNTIRAQTKDEVKSVICKALGEDSWDPIMQGLDEYLDKVTADGAVVQPGTLDGGAPVMQGDGFAVTSDQEWLSFEFASISDQSPLGNLLFGFDQRLAGVNSVLHGQQYQDDTPFEGYRYGIRFDRNEVGLYDYATNHLLAKYIWGIAPSDDYYDPQQNKIMIKFRRRLLDGTLPTSENCKLLPE